MHQTSSYLQLKWGLTTIPKNLVLQFQKTAFFTPNTVYLYKIPIPLHFSMDTYLGNKTRCG